MDYTSLEEITKTLMKVIEDEAGAVPGVFPRLVKDGDGIGFYLFHVQESSHYRNYPALGKDNPPVSTTPMALTLFYQLSVSRKDNGDEDALEQQRLMSLAMKALHDKPVITRTLPSLPNFPLGKEINIKVTLQTLSPSESVQYWAAAESPVRLSAYYEVSVVFLEPEKPKSYAGRVLTYNNIIFVQGTPRITGTESTIEYQAPGDAAVRQVVVQPAQAVPQGAAATVSNQIIFSGSGFEGGTLGLLLTRSGRPLTALATAAWSLTPLSPTKLVATIQQTAVHADTMAPVDILPGLYAAQIVRTEQRTLSDGTISSFRNTSNQFPVSVMPRIDGFGLVGGVQRISGYRFQHPDLKADDVLVFVGESRLDLKNSGVPAAGQFVIVDAGRIDFLPPALPAGDYPLRVMVNGIESAPRWITLP